MNLRNTSRLNQEEEKFTPRDHRVFRSWLKMRLQTWPQEGEVVGKLS